MNAITARRLYCFLLATCALGIAIPMLTVILRLSANDFGLWNMLKWQSPWVGRYTEAAPWLDLARYPFLSKLSWHSAYRLQVHDIYLRYAAFSGILFIALIFGRRRLFPWLEKCAQWSKQPDNPLARKTILITGFLLFFAFVTKSTIFFYWPGVSGWTYQNSQSALQEKLPDDVNKDAIPPFIASAIRPNNSLAYPNSGYLRGTGQFLHFDDGRILPFNDALTGYVFPHYVLGRQRQREGAVETYWQSLQHGLEAARQQRPFLLPSAVSYPRHTLWMPIDYTSYPAPDSLRRISSWEIWIEVQNGEFLQVVAARPTQVIDGQD